MGECCKLVQKRVQDEAWPLEKVIHWALSRRFKFDHITDDDQMVYSQTSIRPRKWNAENFLVLWNTNESFNPGPEEQT